MYVCWRGRVCWSHRRKSAQAFEANGTIFIWIYATGAFRCISECPGWECISAVCQYMWESQSGLAKLRWIVCLMLNVAELNGPLIILQFLTTLQICQPLLITSLSSHSHSPHLPLFCSNLSLKDRACSPSKAFSLNESAFILPLRTIFPLHLHPVMCFL